MKGALDFSRGIAEEDVAVPNLIAQIPHRIRARANESIRNAAGLTHEPPPACLDPVESYQPVDGVARLVHGDLAAMLIGGIGSLFLEMLHPYSMAGVAQHSRYREDTLGRVLQTANFIGDTTYGSRAAAYASIERVKAIHVAVRGVADDGVAYEASDPHLLSWVHVAGTTVFLQSYLRFGPHRLSPEQADQYVMEMAKVASDLGGETPPTTVNELHRQLGAFRPELRLSADGVEARDFLAAGVGGGFVQRFAYRLLVESAYDLLPRWALELLGVAQRPRWQQFAMRHATGVLNTLLRVAVPPTKPVTASM